MSGPSEQHDPQATARTGWFESASGRPVDAGLAVPIGAALQRVFEAASAEWPSLSVPEQTFLRHLGACLSTDDRVWS